MEKEEEKHENLDENIILENNNNKIEEKKENKNINLNFNNHIYITDGNVRSPGKNPIELLAENHYKFIINEDSHYLPTTIDNSKNKLNLFSLRQKNPKNGQKYEINTFKKRFNPINLHNYNQKKKEKLNNKKILNTDNNENTNGGLPFIGLRDTETIFNSLLSKKIKKNGENQNNNYSLNINKAEEENKFIKMHKSPMRFGPKIPSKINPNSIGYKIKSVSKDKKPNFFRLYQDKEQTLFEKIKPNVNNNINNDNNIISNIYINQKKNENRLKHKLNLNMNSINNTRIKGKGITNAVNTFAPGNLALSLSNEKNINRRKKFNRYNYDYEYNFNPSPIKNILIKESYTEALNSTNNINKNNNLNSNNKNITNNEIKTIIPINIKNSDQNIKTIIKKYSDNKVNCKSPEIKSIYNNIKININITNSNSVDKHVGKKEDKLKTLNLNNLQNRIIEQKLYMLTDSNKDLNNNEIYKSIGSSPNKNYINNSERSGKRRGISLLKDVKRDSKYNLTKIIQNVKHENRNNDQKDTIKKNKSYVDNHSSIDNEDQLKNKNNIGRLKIININSDKRKNKEDLLRIILYNNDKIKKIKDNNYKNIKTNGNYLPKLNEHNYNNINENLAKNI